MPFSLHDALIPSLRQILSAVPGVIDKAEIFCTERAIDPADMLAKRLIEDMLPLAYQIKSVATHSAGAIQGVRAGVFSPNMAPAPTTFDACRAVLAEADAVLAAVEPQEMESWIGRDMRFEFRDVRRDFTAETFLLSFSQPNFYFHATTAYAILRAAGVPIGKQDFSGRYRLKD